MFEFRFSIPTSVVFGSGVLRSLGGRVAEQTGSCLLVTGVGSSRRNGGLDQCILSLEQAGVRVTVHDGVPCNAVYEDVLAGADLVRRTASGAIVGVGGGSVMDTARAVSLASTHAGDLWDYRVTGSLGVGGVQATTLPVYTVPTAAGTGAEVSGAALITRDGLKEVFFSPHLFPRAAFVDPALSCTLPAELTARIGVDSFVQGMEAYVSSSATPFSDEFALAAVRLATKWLPRSMAEGTDVNARGNMFVAAILSLFAVNHAGVGAIHALSNPLSGRYGLHHGLALSLLAPEVVRFNWQTRPERYRHLARLVGVPDELLHGEGAREGAAGGIQRWLEAQGLGGRLSSFGATASDLDLLAVESQNPDLGTNPRPLAPADARRIYETVM